jgi:iron(III) transport system ATP-binding protein
MLRVRGLSKVYSRNDQDVSAVKDVSFDVPTGTFFTLLGPSGCGKSTTLRCIAGLERPHAGEIQIGDRLVFSSRPRVFVPAHRRKLSMVFQTYAIWPHMTVAQNIAYPLETQHWARERITEQVRRVLEMVDLPGLEKCPATDLSGGQQQRVAVARAIAAETELLLFDEPLSNIDSKLRLQMRGELRDLQRRLGITTLYVTHDQEEALAVSDTIAVMNEGAIVEMGEAADLYLHPRHRFTASFIGHTNLLPAHVVETNGIFARAETPLGMLTCLKGTAQIGDRLDLCVRPEDLELLPAGTSGSASLDNVVTGTVSLVTFLGSFADWQLTTGDHVLQARIHPRLLPQLGDEVRVRIPPECCYCVQP